MIKAKLYDKKGNPAGEIELPQKAFGIEPNADVLWQYVKSYLANQRSGTHSAKTQSEVSGGGKKPWRQKGTGRARAGSTRSPLWRHGGVIHAVKPRSYRQTFPKKMKKLALASALSDRAKENLVHVFDGFDVPAPKQNESPRFTKNVTQLLKTAEINIQKPTLIITDSIELNLVKGAKNLENLDVTYIGELNPYQVLTAENIIVEKKALDKIEELCQK